jgi:hypothetical protein
MRTGLLKCVDRTEPYLHIFSVVGPNVRTHLACLGRSGRVARYAPQWWRRRHSCSLLAADRAVTACDVRVWLMDYGET